MCSSDLGESMEGANPERGMAVAVGRGVLRNGRVVMAGPMEVEVFVLGVVMDMAMGVNMDLEALPDGPCAHDQKEDADHPFAPRGQGLDGKSLAKSKEKQGDDGHA